MNESVLSREAGPGTSRTRASVKTWVRNQRAIAYAYLIIVLPTVVLLCFLVPPLQVEDESRHFVRAYQIAEGGWIPEVDRGTGRLGGTLPNALGDFIRNWMASESRIGDETLSTVKSRMASLDRAARIERPLSSRRFLSFPSSAIYPPGLYLPQAAGIRAARVFSDKVYKSFYAARVVNAIAAVLLVFLALRLLPQEALLLMFVMALPVTLYHISSISSDAGIISLSILLVALCIRFRRRDGVVIRLGLVNCLILLTMGKPVHLCFGILLLSVHERLGWKRAIRFSSLAIGLAVLSYLSWYYVVKDSMSLAGEGHGQNPSAQIHFITTHPISLILVVLRTLRSDWRWLVLEGIGRVGGWQMYPLPRWFYSAEIGVISCAAACIVLNRKQIRGSRFVLASAAAVGLFAAVALAAYIMWTPPGNPRVLELQARYFVPALPVVAFFAPPLNRFTRLSRNTLSFLTLGFLLISAFTLVRIVDHYFFPRSILIGKNIHSLFTDTSGRYCPAWVTSDWQDAWFGYLANGKAGIRDFRVVLATEEGVILGESDPALVGADFPYELLPGASRGAWRLRAVNPKTDGSGRLWLIKGNSACPIKTLKFVPVEMPDA